MKINVCQSIDQCTIDASVDQWRVHGILLVASFVGFISSLSGNL